MAWIKLRRKKHRIADKTYQCVIYRWRAEVPELSFRGIEKVWYHLWRTPVTDDQNQHRGEIRGIVVAIHSSVNMKPCSPLPLDMTRAEDLE